MPRNSAVNRLQAAWELSEEVPEKDSGEFPCPFDEHGNWIGDGGDPDADDLEFDEPGDTHLQMI